MRESNFDDLSINFRHKKLTGSTNDDVFEVLRQEHSKIVVRTADVQNSGRGKKTRTFLTLDGTNVFLSVGIHKTDLSPDEITTFTAAIVSQAVHLFFNIDVDIKWINDIYYHEKKIAGILSEKNSEGVVVGVGINIFNKNIPDSLSQKVGTLLKNQPEEKIVDEFTTHLIKEIVTLLQGKADNLSLRDTYIRQLNTINRKVSVRIQNKTVHGTAIGIGDKSQLLVVEENTNRLIEIIAGDVTQYEQ